MKKIGALFCLLFISLTAMGNGTCRGFYGISGSDYLKSLSVSRQPTPPVVSLALHSKISELIKIPGAKYFVTAGIFAGSRKITDFTEKELKQMFTQETYENSDPVLMDRESSPSLLSRQLFFLAFTSMKKLLDEHGGKILNQSYFGDLGEGIITMELNSESLSYLMEGHIPYVGLLKNSPLYYHKK